MLINNNPTNLPITKIFQKRGVLINNMLKHLNKSIFIKSLIIKKEILFKYSTQIQVNFNENILINKNIILIPENNKIKKPNKNTIIIETLKG